MLVLNDDQQRAAEAFTAFMVSDDKELVISGGAGVGKTTLLKHLMGMKSPSLVCRLMGKKPIENWALTATTNKAAEVLEEATGIDASTIHSFLGLTVTTDYETGIQKVARKKDSMVVHDTLIIVDEASMVDTPLRRLIDECTMNCKIVYVGDHCQMAPITEAISPVFADNDPIVLNTIIRAANAPPIMELSLKLRETVETGNFFDIQPSPGYIDFLDPDAAKYEIDNVFLTNSHPDARILCYTNNKVIRFNDYIREQRSLPRTFTPGEWVVSNSVCYAINDRKTMLRIEEEVKIEDIGAPEEHIFWVGGDEYSVWVYRIETSKGVFKVPVDANQFRDVLRDVANRAKKSKTNGLWQAYYNLREAVADLRPRDACTVYKAQGSTYHTVFVDLADIGECRNPAQAARMLYVACSRPTHRICFLGQLPNRFRGL